MLVFKGSYFSLVFVRPDLLLVVVVVVVFGERERENVQ